MSQELAAAFAKRFIQRRDVKAIQLSQAGGVLQQGDWFPDSKIDAEKRPNSPHLPHGFKMSHLLAHLAGERTYGHYLLDDASDCKLFAFDIDLESKGNYVTLPDLASLPSDISDDDFNQLMVVQDGVNPRTLWTSRKREALPARNWYKYQMKSLAHMFCTKIMELGLPCAAAYSGSKGVHVYGFTGSMSAYEVRNGALLVLDMMDEFELFKGKNFYRHKNDDPIHGYRNFSVEVFPKQESLDGKTLGNLMRLPLGTNWKNPSHPTFFIDMTTPLATLAPHPDPVALLEKGNPFE